MLHRCYYLLSIDLSYLDSSKINNVSEMFNQLRQVKFINLTNFNPPNVDSLSDFVHNCYSLTSLDMTNCNISSDSYSNAFVSATALISFDLSNWKPSNLEKLIILFLIQEI